MRWWAALLVALLAGSGAAETVEIVRLEGEALVLRLPDLAPQYLDHEQVKGIWTGQLGASAVRVELRLFARPRFRLTEPEQATRVLARNGGYHFAEERLVEGPYGRLAFAALGEAELPDGELIALGGLLDQGAYVLSVEARPALADDARAEVLDFLTRGVRAECEPCDPAWTDEEAQARWDAAVPDEKTRKGLRKVRRTKHYIIFTNSSGGALFARKMEEFYGKIRKVYPFPEVKGRRLMPVFLFRTREEYLRFAQLTTKMPLPQAAASKGHAFLDYYATYYESPNDPVHIHEATHQIFKNRLNLAEGGSWFQEGVAEYMSTKSRARRSWARNAVKRGGFQPFAEFVRVDSLITNPKLDGKSGYLQAASLIEFLREDRARKDRFPEFLERVGRGDDLAATVRALYDTDLAGLEAAWAKHWR